jgi:DNA-binding IscR family transcriptional regulator
LSPLLGRQAIHAIKALLELAGDPGGWRSVNDLAAAQDLPAPMLEQLLLQLRRAGLLEARRGRLGGYRLTRPAGATPLAALLEQRLRAALERELARCTLAELLYDLRSVSAELSDEGGLLLG